MKQDVEVVGRVENLFSALYKLTFVTDKLSLHVKVREKSYREVIEKFNWEKATNLTS